jgi:hypothetical protein
VWRCLSKGSANVDASKEPAAENVIAVAMSPQSVQGDANGDVNAVPAVENVTASATGLDPVKEGAHGVVDIEPATGTTITGTAYLEPVRGAANVARTRPSTQVGWLQSTRMWRSRPTWIW